MRFYYYYAPLRLAAVAVVALMATSALWGKKIETAEERASKSTYVYAEALKVKLEGDNASAFDLMRRAYQLDTANTAAAYYYGYGMMLASRYEPTGEGRLRGLDLMKKHVDRHPDDYYETTFFIDGATTLGRLDYALDASKKLWEIYPHRPDVQTRLADAYARAGQSENAIALYDSVEVLEGKSIDISAKKAMVRLMMRDTLGVMSEMHSLLVTAPRNFSYNIAMGQVMEQIDKPDSALHYYDIAQEIEPENGNVYLAKANYYYMQGDSASYDEQIYKALMLQNIDVEVKIGVLTDYVRSMLRNNIKGERINRLFRALLEQHPHETDIHKLYCEYFMVENDYKRAAEQMSYALDIDPTDAVGWQRLVLLHMLDDNYREAIDVAEQALKLNPDSLQLYRYVAPAYMHMKQYDKALEICDRAIAIVDSTNTMIIGEFEGTKGDVYFAMGDTLRSLTTYEKSLALSPDNALVMNNYAYTLARCNTRLDDAERMAALAVNKSPDNVTYIDTYAWVFYKKGQFDMALLYMRKAMGGKEAENTEMLDHYGDILWVTGNHELALEQWSKAIDVAEDDDDANSIADKLEQRRKEFEQEQLDKENENEQKDSSDIGSGDATGVVPITEKHK